MCSSTDCRSLRRRGVLSGLLMAAVVVPGVAQQPEPDTFAESVDVRVVNVEAVVRDRSGNRVTGLSVDDFELLVDGQPVPITFFEEFVDGRSAGELGSTAVEGASEASSESLRTNYLVYIDDNRTLLPRRQRILENLTEQVRQLGPEDQMAVIVHTGTRLDVLANWTSSQAELLGALEAAGKRPYRGSLFSGVNVTRRNTLGRLGGTDLSDLGVPPFDSFSGGLGRGDVALGNSSVASIRQGGLPEGLATILPTLPSSAAIRRADFQAEDLQMAAQAVISTMQGFEKPVGRNVMLLLGGEWPQGVFNGPGSQVSRNLINDFNVTRAIADTANLLGYTLYPVEVAPAIASLEEWSTQRALAEQTGGRLLAGGLEMAALDTVAEDTSTFYWLGFSPRRAADDRGHSIRVVAKPRGLRVRSRTGYVDFSRQTELAFATRGSLLFGRGQGEHEFGAPESRLALEIGTKRGAGRRVVVPVTVSVPLESLALFDQPGVGQRLEVRLVAMDRQGNESDVAVVPVSVPLEQIRQGGRWELTADLTLRRGAQDVAVTVSDTFGSPPLQAVAAIR